MKFSTEAHEKIEALKEQMKEICEAEGVDISEVLVQDEAPEMEVESSEDESESEGGMSPQGKEASKFAAILALKKKKKPESDEDM